MSRRIYLASSWRNPAQPAAVALLRSAGHEVYDFRNPEGADHGFSWSEIDPEWQSWSTEEYIAALDHQAAHRGFRFDFDAMQWADTFVLLLPCGRSAHLEAGWAVGAGRDLYIVHPDGEEPELMAKMAKLILPSVGDVVGVLEAEGYQPAAAERRCRECGCTDLDCRQCIEKTGLPCLWVGLDLCSACVGQDGRQDRFWSYDGDSYQTHETADEARSECEVALGYFRDVAGDGWGEEVEHIAWGEIREVAEVCDQKGHHSGCDAHDCHAQCEIPGGPRDGCCDYALVAIGTTTSATGKEGPP